MTAIKITGITTLLACLALITGCAPQSYRTVAVTSGTQFAVTGKSTDLYIDLQGILWRLPPEGGQAIALTDVSDDLRRPQLSPDGEWLVAQSFATGAWDIVVLRTDGSEQRNLTVSMHDDREPAWSSDGQSVLFSSDRTGNEDIWMIAVATGELTQLTFDSADDYAPAAAGPDLLFVSERSGKPTLYRQTGTGDTKLLATAPAGRLYPPRVSPDGQTIAWVQAVKRNGFPAVAVYELVAFDIRTGTTRSLSAAGSDIFNMAPAWLNNDTLLYIGDGRVQRINPSTGKTQTLPFAAELPVRSSAFTPCTPLAFSQDEQPMLGIVDPVVLGDNSIVFTALGDLWQLDSDNRLHQLTDDAYVERDVSVSPDGDRLVYISDQDGSMQIWLRDVRSGATRRISDRANGPRYPTFSPDGLLLAYQQVGPIGVQDFTVRVLNLATGKSRKLRSSPKIWPGRMSWAADGTHLTVIELAKSSGRASDGRNRLVRINVHEDTARVIELPDAQTPDFGPVASPDYRQLALIIEGSLWRVPVTKDGLVTAALELVLDELVESPAWAPDGQHIAALTRNGLEMINTRTGQRTVHNPALNWQPAAGQGRQIIHAGRVWDGRSDDYQTDMDIVVDATRIVAVQPHVTHPDGVPVIDAGNKTVLPGLIDHHVHFEPHKGEWIGRSLLAFGITTVVEPGGLPYESREHMESWLSGRRTGPRLVFAGPQLDGMRRTFYFASHINTEQRLRWELERGDRLGYGLLKTYRRMRPELQLRTVQLGHERGLPVTAHAGLRNIGVGGDRSEHMRGSGRMTYSSKLSDSMHSYADIRAIYAAPQASLTPTLVNQGGFFDFALNFDADGAGLEGIEQYTALYTPAYRNNLAGFTQVVSKNIALIRLSLDNTGHTLKQLDAAGVNIVAGTDSPIFPYGLALIIELQNYVDAGLSPAAALRTATTNAAKAMGAIAEVGRIEAGMLADLAIVDGDPLTRITDLINVQGVMLNGRYRSLNELLQGP